MGSFASLNYHVIYSTKNRAPLITAELQPRLFEYTGGIVRDHKGVLLAAGGVADHIHLLVSLSREMAIAECVRLVKANTSKWIHETFPTMHDFAWQTGYAAFTVSFSSLDSVKSYLAKQAEHHRKKTFQEEFIEFLQRHQIEYDPRYLWE